MNDGDDPLRTSAPTSTIANGQPRTRVILAGLVLRMDHLDTGHGPMVGVTDA